MKPIFLTAMILALAGPALAAPATSTNASPFASLTAGAASAPAASTNEATGNEHPMSALAALFDDPVIARAPGLEIKRSQLEETLANYKGRMAELKRPIPDNPTLQKQLLDRLIVTKVLILRASPEDKAKAKESTTGILSNYIATVGSEAKLIRQLTLRGTTLERFRADVLESETARLVMDRELKSKISIPDAEVRAFYTNGIDATVKIMQQQLERLVKDPLAKGNQLSDTKDYIDQLRKTNLKRLESPEQVRVSHILFSTYDPQTEQELPSEKKLAKLEQARKVLARARAGENFTNLVQQFSEDLNLPETHGEYVVMRGGTLAQEFKAAAFSLTNSQISDIVKTGFGYHIIKLLERMPAKKLEYDKAAPDIRSYLQDQEMEKRLPEYFEQVKTEAKVQILDPKYRFSSTAEELLRKTGS